MKLIPFEIRLIVTGDETMTNMTFFHDRWGTTSAPTTSAPQYV